MDELDLSRFNIDDKDVYSGPGNKKPGRPHKALAKLMSRKFTLRLTEEEEEKLKYQAGKRGIPVTSYVKSVLFDAKAFG